MRKLSQQEIAILMAHNACNQEAIFTFEDFEALAEGTATFKVSATADKILDAQRKRMQMPMSRQETFNIFVTKRMFDETVGALNNYLLYLTETLKKKGVVTQEEIDLRGHEIMAERQPDLCPICAHERESCGGEPKTAGEFFKDLTGELAARVVKCEMFRQSQPVDQCAANAVEGE